MSKCIDAGCKIKLREDGTCPRGCSQVRRKRGRKRHSTGVRERQQAASIFAGRR